MNVLTNLEAAINTGFIHLFLVDVDVPASTTVCDGARSH